MACAKGEGGGLLPLALTLGVSATTNMLIGIVLPLLPDALEALQPRFASVGVLDAMLVAAFPAAMMLGSPLAAASASRFGRFALLRACLLLQAGATLTFAFAPRLGKRCGALSSTSERVAMTTTALFVLARLGQGAGAAGCSLSVFAIVADAYPLTLASVMGLNEVAIGVGFTVAPVFSAGLGALGGFCAPFIALVGLTLAMVPLAELCERSQQRQRAARPQLPPAAPASARKGGDVERGPRAGGAERVRTQPCARCAPPAAPVAFAACGVALATCVFGSLNAVLAVRLADLGVPATRIGIAFGALSAAYSISAIAVGIVADRWGQRDACSGYQRAMGSGLLVSALAACALAACAREAPALRALAGAPPDAPRARHAWSDGAMREWWCDVAVLLLLGAGQALALVPSLPALRAAAGLGATSAGPDGSKRARAAAGGAAGGATADGSSTNRVVCAFNVSMQLGMVVGPVLGSALTTTLGFSRAQLCLAALCFAYAAASCAPRCAPARGDSPLPASEPLLVADDATSWREGGGGPPVQRPPNITTGSPPSLRGGKPGALGSAPSSPHGARGAA
ncbi:hypothetical protein KFE25_003489 [Diacronema lutheri]|uniref:Uncharacterized protein n=2 Tax=Diacronema lutheri TaxID=2081491 RepID=A0A8J5X9R6_DIALT|nr:hypothetical protein KFE25_003489 [Diacronema lutheri]